jgi:hypothetical protein
MTSGQFAFLEAIPKEFLFALLGALLPLIGVLISDRSNSKRLKIQLQHDASEKTKERTMELRRDVYLRAAEELVKANQHLGNLPQLDLAKSNVADDLQGFYASVARLQLVAEPNTGLLVSKLIADYNHLFIDLAEQLLPLSDAKSDIEQADRFYETAQTEVNRILGEMRKLNESGRSDPVFFDALNRSFEYENAKCIKYAEERSSAWKRARTARIAAQTFLLGRLKKLSPLSMSLMVEMRKDLGLNGDLSELHRQADENLELMHQRIEGLIAKLSKDDEDN